MHNNLVLGRGWGAALMRVLRMFACDAQKSVLRTINMFFAWYHSVFPLPAASS